MDRYLQIITEIEKMGGALILRGEQLSRHTSFRIGGPAELMIFPEDPQTLAMVCAAFSRAGEAAFVMGNGTNLLFPDDGFVRPIINTSKMHSPAEFVDGDKIRFPAGMNLATAATVAAKNALGGMEFAHGIPGTVGGAVFMNAGAYGGEMKDIVFESRCITPAGEIITLSNAEHGFGYRHSAVAEKGYIVLDTTVQLSAGSTAAIQECMMELANKRRSSQPLEYPSAGSIFKRPENGYAAAMIDQAGLKGLTVGGAQVSEKHAGFMINIGGATCSDVLELIDKVRREVYAKTGTLLETEVRVIV